MLQRRSSKPPSIVTRAADSRSIGCTINLLLIPALIILGLVLPPISLPERILDNGYRTISKNGADFKDKDGTLLSVSPEGMDVIGSTKLNFSSVSRDAFLGKKAGDALAKALNAFPSSLDLKSPVYVINLKGNSPTDAYFSSPTPADAEPYNTLDFYAWDGTKWDFMPGVFYPDDQAEATLKTLPQAIAIVQTKATPPTISAEMAAGAAIPAAAANALVEVNPLGLSVRQDGTLTGTAVSVPSAQSYIVVPTISNFDGNVARSDYVTNMLVNDTSRKAHVQAISDYVVQNLLPGVDINYAGLKPEVKDYFSKFVQELSTELHARGKLLTISVPLPTQVTDDDYDTGAYDWSVIGQMADGIKIPSLTSANAYKTDGPMERLLNWAIGRVSRYKIQFALDTLVQDRVANQTTSRTFEDALKSLVGKIKVDGLTESYAAPLQDVKLNVSVALGFSGFKRDDTTKAYVYAYKDEQSVDHTVYIETAESLTYKMSLAARYHLRGVAFRGLLGGGTDPTVWTAIAQYRQSASVKAPDYSLVWTVTDGKGKQIQTENRPLTGGDTSFTWKAAPVPDKYTIGAAIAANGTPGPGDQVAIAVAIPTETPTPTPSPTPIPTNTPNVPPTARPPTGPAGPAPTARPPVIANNPAPGFFGYGIQVDPSDSLGFTTGKIKNMGFGWVKLQMPWKDVQPSPGAYNWWDGRIDAYAGAGIKVMLSIVKAPRWARPGNTDMSQEGPPSDEHIGDYANFLGQVAARYKGKVGAIEVWNEQNIRNEWGGEPFDPARYMRILCASYAQIKANDPGMVVISGALTPTGAPPPAGTDDQGYLQGMYSNGLKNCADAIGAHPSGFANPPDALYVGGDFDPTRGFDDHRSFFFRNTMEDYRRIMVVNGDGGKRIWPTEFGWGIYRFTGDARFVYMQANTLERQAAWTVQAYQMGKSWGWVGVMFLWNLDYAVTSDNENINFSIVTRAGDTPAYAALAGMPK